MIFTSNEKKEASMGIVVNSNVRVYHEYGRSGKHGVLSHKDLEVGMHLKGLHEVVNVSIWHMHKSTLA